MSRVLQPIVHHDSYNVPVEEEVVAYFKDVIFDPLRDIVAGTRENEAPDTRSAVWAALGAGTLWYADGVFSGTFNAAVSRELRSYGARFDPVTNTFRLAQEDIPLALRGRVAQVKVRSEQIHRDVAHTLEVMSGFILSSVLGFTFAKAVDKMTGDLQKQFVDTVSEVEGLPSATQPPPGMVEAIREGFTTAVEAEVKNFTKTQVEELRAKVLQNLAQGGRLDRLEQIIESRFGVARRKARFIAENETSLAVAKFRKERYASLGVTQYEWQTMDDERVRPDHWLLHGRLFSFDNPPVVDRATGRRCNPGEDYNCRCLALPVIP